MKKNKMLLVLTLGMMLICINLFFIIGNANNVNAEVWGRKDYGIGMYGGSGNESSPFLIATAEEFAQMNYLIYTNPAEYASKCYKLTAPINLSECNWAPISPTEATCFSGTFDGNGQIISGLKMNTNDYSNYKFYGLFGCSIGTIKNVVIKNSTLKVNEGAICVGGLVGDNAGTITSCYVDMDIAASGPTYLGGIVGMAENNKLSKLTFTGSIIGNNVNNTIGGCVGGICGYSDAIAIENCFNSAKISAYLYNENDSSADSLYVGGICGYASSSQIENSYNKGEIKCILVATSDSDICRGGGIVGSAGSSSITSCFNIATLTNCSGIVGFIGGREDVTLATPVSVQNCYNTGEITSSFPLEASVGVAGIIGNIRTIGQYEISKCYNKGSISGNYYISGICGLLYIEETTDNSSNDSYVKINECFNYGAISGDKGYVGGMLGYSVTYKTQVSIVDCGNSGNVTSDESFVGGIVGYFYSKANQTITQCFNTGTISSTGGGWVGGIVGCFTEEKSIFEISNVFNDATVKGKNNCIGGLFGEVSCDDKKSTFTNSFNRGSVKGDSHVGGVFGHWQENKGTNTLVNVHTFGNVSATSNSYVGDFGGRSRNNSLQKFMNCYYFHSDTVKNSLGFGTSGGGGKHFDGVSNISSVSGVSLGNAFDSGATHYVQVSLTCFTNNSCWKVVREGWSSGGYMMLPVYDLKCFSDGTSFDSSNNLIFDNTIWGKENNVNGGHPFLKEFYWIYVA